MPGEGTLGKKQARPLPEFATQPFEYRRLPCLGLVLDRACKVKAVPGLGETAMGGGGGPSAGMHPTALSGAWTGQGDTGQVWMEVLTAWDASYRFGGRVRRGIWAMGSLRGPETGLGRPWTCQTLTRQTVLLPRLPRGVPPILSPVNTTVSIGPSVAFPQTQGALLVSDLPCRRRWAPPGPSFC